MLPNKACEIDCEKLLDSNCIACCFTAEPCLIRGVLFLLATLNSLLNNTFFIEINRLFCCRNVLVSRGKENITALNTDTQLKVTTKFVTSKHCNKAIKKIIVIITIKS